MKFIYPSNKVMFFSFVLLVASVSIMIWEKHNSEQIKLQDCRAKSINENPGDAK